MLPLQWVQARSLVGELRSPTYSMAKKKKRKFLELNKTEHINLKMYMGTVTNFKSEKKHHISGDKDTKQPQVHDPPWHLAWLRNRTRGMEWGWRLCKGRSRRALNALLRGLSCYLERGGKLMRNLPDTGVKVTWPWECWRKALTWRFWLWKTNILDEVLNYRKF